MDCILLLLLKGFGSLRWLCRMDCIPFLWFTVTKLGSIETYIFLFVCFLSTDRRQLIARAVQGGRLIPSSLWQNHSTSSINTDLSFRFRVKCDGNYYGTGCDVLCRESDDPIIGHYGCDANGSRVCLPGWYGESCDKGR